MDALVKVDRAVDGRLDSYSGLDSRSVQIDSVDQSGNNGADSIYGELSGAGVLGGDRTLLNPKLLPERSMISGSAALPSNCAVSLKSIGPSILGMGTSAASTDSRKSCVGAVFRCGAFLFFSRNLCRGGDGGCSGTPCVCGSGVCGPSDLRNIRDRVAESRCKGGIFAGQGGSSMCRKSVCVKLRHWWYWSQVQGPVGMRVVGPVGAEESSDPNRPEL
jgi:hypothetical protein